MGTGKVFIGGVLAGVAAGALLGILLAPEKGSRTRRRIIDKSGEYADDLKSKFEDFYSFITGKLEDTKRTAEHVKDDMEHEDAEAAHVAP